MLFSTLIVNDQPKQAEVLQKANQGKISPALAQLHLLNKQPGTFLLRDSEVQPGVKIFNYVGSDGKLRESRLTPVDEGFKDSALKVYASLEEFFQENKGDLKFPCPIDPSKVLQIPGAFSSKGYGAIKPFYEKQPGYLAPKAKLLEGHPVGTFLIRDSDLHKECKVINYVNGFKEIKKYV